MFRSVNASFSDVAYLEGRAAKGLVWVDNLIGWSYLTVPDQCDQISRGARQR